MDLLDEMTVLLLDLQYEIYESCEVQDSHYDRDDVRDLYAQVDGKRGHNQDAKDYVVDDELLLERVSLFQRAHHTVDPSDAALELVYREAT